MIRIEADDSKLECCVCGTTTTLEGTWTAIASSEPLDETAESGWYLHIHDFGPNDTIDPADTYAFCPEHVPSHPFPTHDENPHFDVEVAIEQLKDSFDDVV